MQWVVHGRETLLQVMNSPIFHVLFVVLLTGRSLNTLVSFVLILQFPVVEVIMLLHNVSSLASYIPTLLIALVFVSPLAGSFTLQMHK